MVVLDVLKQLLQRQALVNLVNFYYPKLTFRSSILELIKENKVTAKAVFDAAKAGDQFCIFITEKVANYIDIYVVLLVLQVIRNISF